MPRDVFKSPEEIEITEDMQIGFHENAVFHEESGLLVFFVWENPQLERELVDDFTFWRQSSFDIRISYDVKKRVPHSVAAFVNWKGGREYCKEFPVPPEAYGMITKAMDDCSRHWHKKTAG